MGKEGWFTILYGYVATKGQFNLPRIYHKHIEMSHCKYFFFIKAAEKSSWNLEYSIILLLFRDNIIFFKYLLLFCIIVFTASLLRIFVQCYDMYVQLHGNFSNSETSHHRHKTRRRRKRKTTRKMRKRTKKWDGVIPPNKWECVNIGLYFQLFDEVKSF